MKWAIYVFQCLSRSSLVLELCRFVKIVRRFVVKCFIYVVCVTSDGAYHGEPDPHIPLHLLGRCHVQPHGR